MESHLCSLHLRLFLWLTSKDLNVFKIFHQKHRFTFCRFEQQSESKITAPLLRPCTHTSLEARYLARSLPVNAFQPDALSMLFNNVAVSLYSASPTIVLHYYACGTNGAYLFYITYNAQVDNQRLRTWAAAEASRGRRNITVSKLASIYWA